MPVGNVESCENTFGELEVMLLKTHLGKTVFPGPAISPGMGMAIPSLK
jgi:hypothetical protein